MSSKLTFSSGEQHSEPWIRASIFFIFYNLLLFLGCFVSCCLAPLRPFFCVGSSKVQNQSLINDQAWSMPSLGKQGHKPWLVILLSCSPLSFSYVQEASTFLVILWSCFPFVLSCVKKVGAMNLLERQRLKSSHCHHILPLQVRKPSCTPLWSCLKCSMSKLCIMNFASKFYTLELCTLELYVDIWCFGVWHSKLYVKVFHFTSLCFEL
jgi:hypothetical protein